MSSSQFDLFVGIDYSGAKTPLARSATLQVYGATCSLDAAILKSPAASSGKHRNWNRKEIAQWIVSTIKSGKRLIAGIDHGFSFPISYFNHYEISSWYAFLDDFSTHWPTHMDDVTVDTIRRSNIVPPVRTGSSKELRLCEQWTPSAKGVFLFDVQGSVAKSTHAGLPWLQHIRDEIGDRIHFWPFDGWDIPQGKSVLAEVYPSIFRRRFPVMDRSADQHDAYCVSQWLKTAAESNILQRYFSPPLNEEEREVAILEGWILGVS